MNRILVIAEGESDLLDIMKNELSVEVISPKSYSFDISAYDSLCILGGNLPGPIQMAPPLHDAVCKFRAMGKPIFAEFFQTLGEIVGRGMANVERQRAIYLSDDFPIPELSDGDLFDAQANQCVKVMTNLSGVRPILSFREYTCAHDNIQVTKEEHREGIWGLWWLDDHTLISSMRLCNFHRARFAPTDRWELVIDGILSFLAGGKIVAKRLSPVITHKKTVVSCANDAKDGIKRGINWITDSGMPIDGGKGGSSEGLSSRIDARTGKHDKVIKARTDCTGEIAGALLLHSLRTGDGGARQLADDMFKFAFDWMQVKDGLHRGMLRWSEIAWEICYQDDAARAILGLLLSQHFGIQIPYFDEIKLALDYMVMTTAGDGIRPPCTEIRYITEENIADLRKPTVAEPCAHFNAYYHAVLLLAYEACGKKEYFDCALSGLSTLMAAYPDTRRETSETEEQCRLVLPLAILYGITGDMEHYGWLCRVSDDLEKRRHPSGGYAEWDTGYKAGCSRNHKGECALLANNGDPVADLLYSNNWLPLGFAYAYFATGEKRFYECWCSVAGFMLSAQIHSDDKMENGAWERAFDLDRGVIYGIPYDVGWGPYCIESGWTVGEILMGLEFMFVAEKKHGIPNK